MLPALVYGAQLKPGVTQGASPKRTIKVLTFETPLLSNTVKGRGKSRS
jgi:hypothetical protein